MIAGLFLLKKSHFLALAPSHRVFSGPGAGGAVFFYGLPSHGGHGASDSRRTKPSHGYGLDSESGAQLEI